MSDKYLSKEGLQYYHGKIAHRLDSAVTVNVTQSAHQTITYRVSSPYDWYTYTTDGIPGWDDSNLPSTGATFRFAVPVYLSLNVDSGYVPGTWVLIGDVLDQERPAESYEYMNFEALVFLGETLNVSVTPATTPTVTPS